MDPFTSWWSAHRFVGTTSAQAIASRFNGSIIPLSLGYSSITTTGGRDNAPYLTFSGYFTVSGLLTTNVQERVGFHWYDTALNGDIWSKWSGGTRRCALFANSNGTLSWFQGATAVATSSLTIAATTNYFISIVVDLQTTATGSVKVYVNEVEYINATGIITTSGTAPTGTFLSNGRCECYFHINSTGDEIPNLAVSAVRPTGNASDQDFTPNTGNAYEAVDAIDSDYIESDAENDISMFTHGNGIVAGDVHAVALTGMLSKAATGLMGVKLRLGVSGGHALSTIIIPTTTKRLDTIAWNEDPVTEAAWDATDLNPAEIGVLNTLTA